MEENVNFLKCHDVYDQAVPGTAPFTNNWTVSLMRYLYHDLLSVFDISKYTSELCFLS